MARLKKLVQTLSERTAEDIAPEDTLLRADEHAPSDQRKKVSENQEDQAFAHAACHGAFASTLSNLTNMGTAAQSNKNGFGDVFPNMGILSASLATDQRFVVLNELVWDHGVPPSSPEIGSESKTRAAGPRPFSDGGDSGLMNACWKWKTSTLEIVPVAVTITGSPDLKESTIPIQPSSYSEFDGIDLSGRRKP